MSPRALALGLAVAVAALGPRPAAADGPSVVDMRFLERGSTVFLSTDVTSVLDEPAYWRLDNGLPSTVVVRVWLYPKDRNRPVAFHILQREVVYDLWDEVYQVALTSPNTGRRVYTVKFRSDAIKLMCGLDRVPIAALGGLAYDTDYEAAIIAELNPLSPQTLAEVRRWLTDGAGTGLDRGGSFFGSFVSVFVNFKVPEADRVVRFRSKPYRRLPPPPAPAPTP